MKTTDLKKQLVDLLISAHVTFGTHEIAEYLIKHGVTIQPKLRCNKCVYELSCLKNKDNTHKCPDYKRDAPDGGYYG